MVCKPGGATRSHPTMHSKVQNLIKWRLELHNFQKPFWLLNTIFLKYYCESESHSDVSDSLRLHGLYSPWNSPGQNTGVGSLSLLQGIFPTKGSNPGLLHCRQILYQLSHKGSPRILKWVAFPFSSGSSQPKNQTGVSCIVSGFFTNWAIREAPKTKKINFCWLYAYQSPKIAILWWKMQTFAGLK